MFLSKHVTYPKEFVVNDIKLQVEDYVELLGVIIDKNLNFSRHLEKLCKSAKFKLMPFYVPKEINLKTKFESLVLDKITLSASASETLTRYYYWWKTNFQWTHKKALQTNRTKDQCIGKVSQFYDLWTEKNTIQLFCQVAI